MFVLLSEVGLEVRNLKKGVTWFCSRSTKKFRLSQRSIHVLTKVSNITENILSFSNQSFAAN